MRTFNYSQLDKMAMRLTYALEEIKVVWCRAFELDHQEERKDRRREGRADEEQEEVSSFIQNFRKILLVLTLMFKVFFNMRLNGSDWNFKMGYAT